MPGASEAHAAACAGWDPGVSTDQKPGQESKSIKVDWSGTAPAACDNAGADDWTGTDHYQIHRADGTTPPSTPSGATKVKEVDSAATSATDITHRSDKTFAYALFACMDSTCT
ncbi:MAG TPA: hypothetical protein QGF58_16625, partial [Myxococcota bacterium]|nr:hypothetical protein [Myxococcota bacterium]